MYFGGFLFLAILAKISTAEVTEKDFYKHVLEYEDFEYDDKSEHVPKKSSFIEDLTEDDEYPDKTDKPETSNRPVSSYEVVEVVDDIPNNVTFRPIVTNFTIKLPLNNASEVSNNNKENNNKSGILSFLLGNDKNENLRKNSINIFHVSAVFDDEKDKKPIIQNINIHKPFGIFKIKDAVDKLNEDVFHSVHNTEIYNAPNDVYLPHILVGAKNFIRKLGEKGSAFFHKYFK